MKLASGDTTWRDLTALLYHYETQPLPTPLAWYAHQLPAWAQKASCAGVRARVTLAVAVRIEGEPKALPTRLADVSAAKRISASTSDAVQLSPASSRA